MHQVPKILFCHEILHVSGIYSAHHQELSAVHVAIGKFHADEAYQLPRVQLITPDDGQSRCPKHVEFRDKIKFWVLVASC
jgi:hypothetical protein